MMSANLCCIDFDKSYSYQHLHGLMLVELNKLASDIKLTHTQYRLMGILIGLWNKEHNKAFPTLDYLAKCCRMSKTTILKSLTVLINKNILLVVKQPKNKRNNYYLNTNLFLKGISTHEKLTNSTSCETMHDNKLIKIKTNKKLSLNLQSKNYDDLNYKKIIQTLQKWQVKNYQQIIVQNKIEHLLEIIDKVTKYNPVNPGAYLRTLLSNSIIEEIIVNKENLILKKLITASHCKHIPSGKIIKIKPETGNHLLFKYDKESNQIIFSEDPLIDDISKFEAVYLTDDELKQRNNTKKPSKTQLLDNLLAQGEINQAKYLAKIWKIKLSL